MRVVLDVEGVVEDTVRRYRVELVDSGLRVHSIYWWFSSSDRIAATSSSALPPNAYVLELPP